MTALPRLALSRHHRSPFDEAMIIIGGHEDETIRIECEGARELAEQLVRLVNQHRAAIEPPVEQAPYDPGPGVVRL